MANARTESTDQKVKVKDTASRVNYQIYGGIHYQRSAAYELTCHHVIRTTWQILTAIHSSIRESKGEFRMHYLNRLFALMPVVLRDTGSHFHR